MSDPASSGLPPSLENLFADQPEVLTLPNGLTVIYLPSTAHPLVSAQVWIKTGSIHEDPWHGCGLSHFLEHMLFKGTERRGPGAIAREVQEFGGHINAYTAFDRTVYFIDGPAESLDRILDLLADFTLGAALPAAEVDKEKAVILREIDMTLDDPDRILSRAMFSTAYREHPFRYPVIGLRPLFEAVDRERLMAYYKARYQPNNMVLTVAGQFDPEVLLQLVDRTFAKAPRGTLRPAGVPAEPRQLALREVRRYGDYQTARGLLAWKIPGIRHADAPVLDIIASILGAGHSGRLRQKLREELGLVHDISVTAWNPGDPGLFWVHYQCDPAKAARAEEAIRACLEQDAAAGFTAAELEKALNMACASETQSRQTTSGLAARLGLVGALVGDLNYPRRYFERIHQITLDELRSVAARTFRPDQLTLATLLPEASRPQARARAASSALGGFEQRTLANGARICWQPDHRLPRVWMRLSGLGGPLLEDPGRHGATALLSTLLTRDTRHRSAQQVAEELESKGGFMVGDSGNNTFSLSVEVVPEVADGGLRALRDALFHPAFKAATVERERAAQLADIREQFDDVLDFGRLALRSQFFGKHPFAADPAGTLESVARIDAAHLRALRRRLLTGPNCVLVLTGDFDPDRLLPQAEKILLRLPATADGPPSIPFEGPATSGEVTRHLNREQAVVFDAFPDVGFQPEAHLTGQLIDELLSDMSGPLFRSVREDQSLAYFVGASRLLARHYGAFILYAGTHPSTTAAVYTCFDRELERLRQGDVVEAELRAAATRLKVQTRFSLQSPAARAARVALNALYGKPIMDWLDFEQRVDALGVHDVTAFAQAQLRTDRRLRLTVTPKID